VQCRLFVLQIVIAEFIRRDRLNNAGLVLIGILGIGILAKWSGRLTPNEGTALAVVIFNLTIPAAGFMALINVKLDQSALFLPLIALIVPLVLLLIAYLMELRIKADANEQVRGVFMAGVTLANIGYFAFPVFQTYFGDLGLSRVALYNIGTALTSQTVTYAVAYNYGLKSTSQGKATIFNWQNLRGVILAPPVWGVVAAVVCNLLTIPVPGLILSILDTLKEVNTPLVILMLASFLNVTFKHRRLLMLGVVVRIALGFCVGWIFGWLFHLSPFDRFIAAAASGMPVGMSVLIFSASEKLDTEFAATFITLSMIIDLILVIILFPLVSI
jgi:malate permease and related proteins